MNSIISTFKPVASLTSLIAAPWRVSPTSILPLGNTHKFAENLLQIATSDLEFITTPPAEDISFSLDLFDVINSSLILIFFLILYINA